MTLPEYQRRTLAQLAQQPLTAAELQTAMSWPTSSVEAALRTLLAAGRIQISEIRHRGITGGSGRPARVYHTVKK